ncbi:hypothetical protein NIES4102_17230 [Chondrocystis sp. NIES-4102]|nr:hypothetical protein NIES4102_17230 [Chondrocystis sp. NIES-4102]
MKLNIIQKTIAGIGITTFSVILSGQVAQAESIVEQNPQSIKPTVSNSISPAQTSENNNYQIEKSQDLKITQRNLRVDPGTATRSGASYIGIGGNLGLSGDTSVGDGAFAVISKIGLTNTISVRPSVLIEDDTAFLIPVTVDFSQNRVSNAAFNIAPYLGGGLAFSTGRDDTIGLLISGGLDIPISSEFTGNAAVNVSFIDDTDVGVVLGVGYNF